MIAVVVVDPRFGAGVDALAHEEGAHRVRDALGVDLARLGGVLGPRGPSVCATLAVTARLVGVALDLAGAPGLPALAIGLGAGPGAVGPDGQPWGSEAYRAYRLAVSLEPGVRVTEAFLRASGLPEGVGAHHLPAAEVSRLGFVGFRVEDHRSDVRAGGSDRARY